ncbi:DUF4281 domain-containing protein [Alteromonadaceae bacterium M269]|nr:DUF4281 domain-containing protein [Alteromonadaceae bacterium M269]
MEPDQLFIFFNRSILPAWLLLIFAPRWRWTQAIIFHAWIPSFLAVFYIYAFVSNPVFPEDGNFLTLEGVMVLFQQPYLVLAGWIHYLAFDLFIGAWQVRDAQRRDIHHLWVVPCLIMTLVFGPAGLLLYFIVRYWLVRTLTTREVDIAS